MGIFTYICSMEQKELNYGAGVQSFEKLRHTNSIYIDKTRFIWELVNQPSPIFLSRPRRFGKSLFLSTLEAYFQGRRDLFDGTFISGVETEWKKYPVIHIDLNSSNFQTKEGVIDVLSRQLDIYEREWAIPRPESESPEGRLENIILEARKKFGQNVVLLFDEYDKPLISNLHDAQLLNEIRSILKPVYGLIKSLDKCIRFAMITGVSRFSKTSIFSDVNNLVDISFIDQFNDICGISESELKRDFYLSISNLAKKLNLDIDQTRKILKTNYDGYHFADPAVTEGIYNPFSLISVFKFNRIFDYWFDSGTPTFLVKNLIANNFDYKKLEGMAISQVKLQQSDTLSGDPIVLLFQTGYLTIKSVPMPMMYTIGFPNEEVERSFYNLLLTYSIGTKYADTAAQDTPRYLRPDLAN